MKPCHQPGPGSWPHELRPLVAGVPTPATATAVEYCHAAFNHCFVTAIADEITKPDNGVRFTFSREVSFCLFGDLSTKGLVCLLAQARTGAVDVMTSAARYWNAWGTIHHLMPAGGLAATGGEHVGGIQCANGVPLRRDSHVGAPWALIKWLGR